MPNIRHELFIGATAEHVYRAITSQEGLSAWWTSTNAKPEPDSVAHFAFGPDYFKEMKITALTPSKQVNWTCIAGADEWIGTNISFTLHADDKDTLLKIHPEAKDQIQQQRNGGNGTLLSLHH